MNKPFPSIVRHAGWNVWSLASLWLCTLSAPSLAAVKLPEPVKRAVDFTRDVQPIFTAHCIKCHGEEKPKGQFRVDQRQSLVAGGDSGEPGIAPGKSAESHLIKLVAETVEGEVMPPKGRALTDEQVAILRAWVDQGAKWGQGVPGGDDPDGAGPRMQRGDHWSLQPVKRPAAPAVKHQDWVRTPIDAFIAQKLEAGGLSPSPRADRATLVRRAFLVLTGLPPTPGQVEAFVKDERPDAISHLVDSLLASPRYGERWARHWLDVARFAETNGFETNTPRPNAWHYRDYVISAFNDDKPYDRFIREQLAGDALDEDAGTGFLVGGPYDQVKSPDIGLTLMQRSDELNDIVNTTSTAFLGLTVACARCHNHKFDPVSQKDYFSFMGVFAGVNHGDRPLRRRLTPQQQQQADALKNELESLKAQAARIEETGRGLAAARPGEKAAAARTILIDDETTAAAARVTHLLKPNPPGVNPTGSQRGHRGDPGDIDRMPNLSGGRYLWWNHQPATDFITYHPHAAGRFRIWISWGSGHATHAVDAQYLLDLDGDLKTRDDQKLLATVDQRHFAGATDAQRKQPPAGKPLWSGLHFAGTHEIQERSVIVLRSGKSDSKAITADVVVFQEETADESGGPKAQVQQAGVIHPRLRDPVNSRMNEEVFAPQKAKFVRFTIHAANSGEPCIDELEVHSVALGTMPSRNVAPDARPTSSGDYSGNPLHQLKHVNDGKVGNSHSWISNTNGAGWVQLELPEPAVIHRIVWGRDRTRQYADRTATQYAIEVSADEANPENWVTVASSQDRVPFGATLEDLPAYRFAGLSREQADELRRLTGEIVRMQKRIDSFAASPVGYLGGFSQPAPVRRLFRGDPLAPREVVEPGALEMFGQDLKLTNNTSEQQRRIALADWIAGKDNPLTARVMVNRIWQHHFGTGIVDTPSDFGKMGTKPTHPQLLDWLADEFVKSGWSIKHLQKLIVTSAVWQQSSRPRDEPLKVDAGARLLWRFPPQRLEAEAIRDSILAVAGTLNERMGGPGWNAFKANDNYVRVYTPKEEFTGDDLRRMIYMYKVRMEHDATFGAFDCPDAGQPTASRTKSTTAIQALSLFNSSIVMQQAQAMASRLQKEAGEQPSAQVKTAFMLCFGRLPQPKELDASVSFIGSQGLPAFCRAMLNANEFLFVP